MHSFAVTMAAHERLIKKYLANYSEANHLKPLELHAVLSHLVYEIEKGNDGLAMVRENLTEAQKLHDSLLEDSKPKTFTSAERLVESVIEDDEDDDDEDEDDEDYE